MFKHKVNNTFFIFQIWDSAGQERFRTLTTTYYRGAHAIIIVYDITDRSTFVNIGAWLNEINKNAIDNVLIAIVGNKCDRNDIREVEEETAKAFADRLGVIFLESSAKEDINIHKLFHDIAAELKKRLAPSKDHALESQKLINKHSFSGSEICSRNTMLPQCCSMQ